MDTLSFLLLGNEEKLSYIWYFVNEKGLPAEARKALKKNDAIRGREVVLTTSDAL
jgi:hypothetical protein